MQGAYHAVFAVDEVRHAEICEVSGVKLGRDAGDAAELHGNVEEKGNEAYKDTSPGPKII